MQTWILYALGAAAAAALTGIFAKIGTEGIDSTMATAVRAIVGAFYLTLVATALGKWPHLKNLNLKATAMFILAGLAGSTSWLLQYKAYAIGGPVSKMAAIDKLSVPMAVILAVIFLRERLFPINWAGVILVVIGAYLVAYSPIKN
jgi:transporter family protein